MGPRKTGTMGKTGDNTEKHACGYYMGSIMIPPGTVQKPSI